MIYVILKFIFPVKIRGDKCLVIDPKLSGALSLLVQSSELKILEEEKVHELLNIGEFPLYMLPLDEDVLSFELDLAEKEYLVDGDGTALWHIAKAIHNLEFSFGVIPNVRAKGKASARVADILTRMQTEEPANTSNMGIPEINTLILLDREVDMITPMCTQLTYEGLVDECLGIDNGAVELDASIMGAQQDGKKMKVDMITPMCTQLTYEGLVDECLGIDNGAVELDASIMGAQQDGKKMKVPLNSSDKLFKETRDLNFEVVVQVLRQKATSMKQDYSDISTTTQTVSELKDFVKKLNSLPEMTRHINLAQHLTTFTSKPLFLGRLDMEQTLVEAQSYDICFEYIEEMIFKQESLLNVLRFLILFSVTNSGLPKKHFDYLRRELLQSYGFEHMATLDNLEKAGLFRKQDSRSNWMTIKRALQLVVEDTDTTNPNDISYVFSGYAPLSIRLVQQAIRSGWRPIEEILRLLPGPHLETKRGGFSSIPSYDTLPGSLNSLEKLANGRRALVLVVFIGGVTFAEISALRFLSSQEGMAYDVIVGTTKVINGRTLIKTFLGKWDQ
ncbi:Sec1/munc18-like proteins superfamily [Perilla frutescens var. hirtella]|uniref:Sec1/munc18-like proteins superfamily n=1 Tax=Perilla frutescens var. hirtella TaxID=608512 RepID=A0AAD4JIB7_PERFH|nr:Sec1/munc18-like proteins superfamily [Perilla frutescens var. hirtella]